MALGVAMAQPPQPQTPPAQNSQQQNATQSDQQQQKSTQSDKNQKMSDQKMNANSASTSTALPELKTTSFKGILVDMSCASQSSGTDKSAATTTADRSTTTDKSASNDKSAGANDCPVSANSSQFGLKMDDGKTVRFDLVGNQRAQDAVKNQKSWSKDLSANKPIHAKVSGVLNGDKLIVSSIH